jgi:very-short-patch-repair endonuclease
LVIEIDGSSHDYKEEYDQKRRISTIFRIKVYRISDLRVKHDLNNVNELEQYIVVEFVNKLLTFEKWD